MKWIRFLLPVLALAVAASAVGCKEQPAPTPLTPTPAAPVVSVPTTTPPADITLDLPGDRTWTWNALHDYLENPRQSGDLAFDPAEGEYIALYDTDWITLLSGWNRPLKQDMMVIRYDKNDEILCRYYVNYTAAGSSTPAPASSVPASSAPAPQPASSAASATAVSSRPAASSPVEETVPPEPLPLTVTGALQGNALAQAARAYTRQNSTVTVTAAPGGPVTAADLAEMAKKGALPDVVLMERDQMALAAEAGLLYDLTYAGADRLESRFDPVCWSRSMVNGARCGLPLGCAVWCLACNDELLFQCDATLPATRRDLVHVLQTVRDTLPDAIPFGLCTDPADVTGMANQFACLLWSARGDLLAPDGRTAAFNSPAGESALTLMATLCREGYARPDYGYNDFFAGATAFGLVCSTEYEITFGSRAKARFTPVTFVEEGGRLTGPLTLYAYCVPQDIDNARKAAAFDFLNWYSDSGHSEWSLAACRAAGLVPAQSDARADDYYQTDAWQAFIAALPDARPLPAVDCLDTLQGYWAQTVTAAQAGGDVPALLQAAAEKTDRRLERAN